MGEGHVAHTPDEAYLPGQAVVARTQVWAVLDLTYPGPPVLTGHTPGSLQYTHFL